MAQWVRTLAAETADLSLTPVTDSFKLLSDLHMRTIHACTCMHRHTYIPLFKKVDRVASFPTSVLFLTPELPTVTGLLSL